LTPPTPQPPRIGFFGGSFDPPHAGHLALAELAIQALDLDRLLMAPVGLQPLKRDRHASPFADRLAMVKLAVGGHPSIEVSDADAPRGDGRPNYIIETLQHLRSELAGNTELVSICGADAFLTIGKWHKAADLLMEFPFVVGARPGFDLGRIAHALPGSISVASEDDPTPGRLTLGLRDAHGRLSRLYLLPGLSKDVSATEIRNGWFTAGATANVLAPAVLEYIRAHGLYQDPTSNR
jgi:nicotinate-nucleotide adenylyltransferase